MSGRVSICLRQSPCGVPIWRGSLPPSLPMFIFLPNFSRNRRAQRLAKGGGNRRKFFRLLRPAEFTSTSHCDSEGATSDNGPLMAKKAASNSCISKTPPGFKHASVRSKSVFQSAMEPAIHPETRAEGSVHVFSSCDVESGVEMGSSTCQFTFFHAPSRSTRQVTSSNPPQHHR